MNIYELDAEIEAFEVKIEAYEGNEEKVEALRDGLAYLKGERDWKIKNMGRWYKNLTASVDAYASEIRTLQARKKSAQAKADSIKNFLGTVVLKIGEKYDDGAVKISWRAKPAELIFDEEKVPDELKKIEVTYKKAEMRKLLKPTEKDEDGDMIPVKKDWGYLEPVDDKTIWIR